MMILGVITAILAFFVALMFGIPQSFLIIIQMFYLFIYDISNVFGYLDSFIDLNIVVRMIGLIIAVDNLTFISDAIVWLWKKVPVIGGS